VALAVNGTRAVAFAQGILEFVTGFEEFEIEASVAGEDERGRAIDSGLVRDDLH
jgi:hypothetical protein